MYVSGYEAFKSHRALLSVALTLDEDLHTIWTAKLIQASTPGTRYDIWPLNQAFTSKQALRIMQCACLDLVNMCVKFTSKSFEFKTLLTDVFF